MAGNQDLAFFVNTVNDWFDVMDSRGFHKYNQNKCGLGVNYEKQEKSLRNMLEVTQSMVVGPTKTMKNCRKAMVPFQTGIICSINATFALWDELRAEGFKWLLTHKLNQDCLENFFSAVRALGGGDTNPNSVQFCNRLRILKMKNNFDAISILIDDKGTSVELSSVDDERLEEPFVASEIGREKNSN